MKQQIEIDVPAGYKALLGRDIENYLPEGARYLDGRQAWGIPRNSDLYIILDTPPPEHRPWTVEEWEAHIGAVLKRDDGQVGVLLAIDHYAHDSGNAEYLCVSMNRTSSPSEFTHWRWPGETEWREVGEVE